MRRILTTWLLAAVVLGLAAQRPIAHYTVQATTTAGASIPLQVTLRVEHAPGPELRVAIPVWAPGSYRLQPFPEKIKAVAATGAEGVALAVKQLEPHLWSITTGGASEVTVSYRVDLAGNARFMQRGDSRRAITYEGPEAYLYLVGHEQSPCFVRFVLPQGWRQASGLVPLEDGRFAAKDYDTLADCPVKLGAFQTYSCTVDEKPIELVVDAPEPIEFAAGPWVANVQKIVATQAAIFGGLPFDRYVFLFTASNSPLGAGGLEHLNSTCIGLSAAALRRDPKAGLSVISHEFFHLWNVKRLRPRELGPFDYTRPVRSDHLWLMEGVTSYYAEVALARAGLRGEREFWESMARQIGTFESSPARASVSSETASRMVWDRPPRERTVDYYNSGLVLGLCLDLELRAHSKNARSLDDVMRALYRFCLQEGRGFEKAELVRVASEAGGCDLAPFFARHVAGTEPPPYAKLLEPAGIRYAEEARTTRVVRGAQAVQREGKAIWTYSEAGGGRRDPAAETIVAVAGKPLGDDDFEARLEACTPGTRVELELERGGDKRTVEVRVEERKRVTAKLGLDEDASAAALKLRRGITAPAAD